IGGVLCLNCSAWIDRRGQRNGNGGGPRQIRAIAQKSASPCKGHGNDGRAGRYGGLECAKLKRPHAIFGSESAFRKNKNRFAVAHEFSHPLPLPHSSFRIGPVQLPTPPPLHQPP